VNQFTSDCCLWVDNVARADIKKDQHDNRLPDHLPVKQSQAWCRFGTVIGQNMQRSPASGVLAAVARGKQGLEPRSVGLDEETFNLDFIMEEERLTLPTSIRFLTVKKRAGRKTTRNDLVASAENARSESNTVCLNIAGDGQ
jgi:hypothetical protein